MTTQDLKYIAKVIRKYCKDKYNVTVIPDYQSGIIEIAGLPKGTHAIDVCVCIKEKNVPVFDRGENKVLIKF